MKITLGAGNETTTSSVGYNFAYISGEGDIKVVLMNNDSVVIEESVLKVGQDLVGAPERFEKVRITNLHDNEQTIEFSTGSMRLVDTNNGSTVTVTSASDVDIATLPDVVVSSTPDNPQKYFGRNSEDIIFESSNGSGLKTYVQPFENVSGVIIYLVNAYTPSTGASVVVIDTTAPTSYLDGCVLASSYGASGGYNSQNAASCLPFLIPAGYGVYGFTTTANNKNSLVYEVL